LDIFSRVPLIVRYSEAIFIKFYIVMGNRSK
jgi:hypothetical protein